MVRRYLVQCFLYSSEGSLELWESRYYDSLEIAQKYALFRFDFYDQVIISKVK